MMGREVPNGRGQRGGSRLRRVCTGIGTRFPRPDLFPQPDKEVLEPENHGHFVPDAKEAGGAAAFPKRGGSHFSGAPCGRAGPTVPAENAASGGSIAGLIGLFGAGAFLVLVGLLLLFGG